jgi:hypothetical protein
MATKTASEVVPDAPVEEAKPMFNEQTNYVPVKTIITVSFFTPMCSFVDAHYKSRYS